MIKTLNIGSLSEIRFGYYSQPDENGDTLYLQVRHFSQTGYGLEEPDEYIKLDQKSENHLLKAGDVLFVGKGNRMFSWCYSKYDRPAIASSTFFVIRPDQKLVYPEYLSAILNAPQSKIAFQQLGGGTNIFSIRKSELGAFEIPLPSMDQQMKIAAIAHLHQQELALAERLIEKKQNLYNSVISKLTK